MSKYPSQDKIIGYCSSVTEYEAGWGSRPDGYVIAFDKEKLQIRINEINSQRGSEYCRCDKITLCILSPLAADQILAADSGTVWTSRSVKDLILEMN